MQPKQAPQRTCIACREVSGKREFVRVVRTPESRIELDLTGKKPGRGAYLHPDFTCWEQALKKGRLEAALKTKLTPDDRLQLTEFATSLREAMVV